MEVSTENDENNRKSWVLAICKSWTFKILSWRLLEGSLTSLERFRINRRLKLSKLCWDSRLNCWHEKLQKFPQVTELPKHNKSLRFEVKHEIFWNVKLDKLFSVISWTWKAQKVLSSSTKVFFNIFFKFQMFLTQQLIYRCFVTPWKSFLQRWFISQLRICFSCFELNIPELLGLYESAAMICKSRTCF